MTFDVSKLSGNSNIPASPIIGAVKVNKPFTYHDNHYECAAWWEDHQAVEGVHPVYLTRNHLHPKELVLRADIEAKVIDDYFPALWGGVRISNEPYVAKHIGESRTIRQSIDIIQAIERTGNSPGNDLDWFIHPSWWQVFADEAVTELRDAYRRFPEFYEPWAKLDVHIDSFQPRKVGGSQWNADDEYRSKVSMIGYFGGLFEKCSRRIEKISWHSQYHKVGSRYNTDYNKKLFAENTEWAKAVPILVNE